MNEKIKKFICTIISSIGMLIVFAFFIYISMWLLFLKPSGLFRVNRINSDSNQCKNEKEYFYQVLRDIYHYSFDSKETEIKTLLSTEYFMEDSVAWNGMVYYVKKNGQEREIRRFNYKTEEDALLLSGEEITSIYNGKKGGIDRVELEMFNGLLVVGIKGGQQGWYVCLYPVENEGRKADYIDMNKIFLNLDEFIYEGMVVKRYYDTETESYKILQINAEETGHSILSGPQGSVIVDGRNVWISHESGVEGAAYWVEGKEGERKIECLQGEEYEYSCIYEDRVTVENGEIIGLVRVLNDWRANSANPYQSDLKYEVMFNLNPETGENAIIYKTPNRRTRIIGYRDGTVYLLKNYKVYEESIKSGERRFLFSLPKLHDYEFDWQGNYLIVMNIDGLGHYEVAAHYKVE